jgi:polyferredoxin
VTATPRTDLLTRYPWLKRLLASRLFQPVAMLALLAGFTIVILTGFFGTPAGSRNFAIIMVWIVWWGLLIVGLIPALGRAWCAVCPLPAPGEWLQRRGIIRRVMAAPLTRKLRWPRRLKNMWLQNLGFLAVAVFSAIILTRPAVSAGVLLGFIVAGLALSLLYERRVFCKYVCPVGGFISLYSLTAPVGLRAKDPAVCASHRSKDCVTGNERGYGCPWLAYPGNLTRNIDCGLCMECLKTCPKDNIGLFTRPVGSDLLVEKGRGLDEAYKGFIMLSCALLYSAVLLGPWGQVKDWANMGSLPGWALYAAGFVAINRVVVPGVFWLVTRLTGRLAGGAAAPRRVFVNYAYTLVPLGLAAWIAFSLSFVLTNGSYALPVLSDPFGWGWNLLGTASISWQPLAGPGVIALLQTGALVGGLVFAGRTALRIARQQGHPRRAAAPVVGFLLAVTLSFFWLYLG